GFLLVGWVVRRRVPRGRGRRFRCRRPVGRLVQRRLSRLLRRASCRSRRGILGSCSAWTEVHSSCCSASTAPTSLITATRLGKMPTTSVRLRISLLSRSFGLFDQIFFHTSFGNF